MDMNNPANGFGSAASTEDPVQHKLWKKYVTFHEGKSTDAHIVEAISRAAAGASRVLVLLDSDHGAQNVAREIELYCKKFVTVGSYCVVEVRCGGCGGAGCGGGRRRLCMMHNVM